MAVARFVADLMAFTGFSVFSDCLAKHHCVHDNDSIPPLLGSHIGDDTLASRDGRMSRVRQGV